LTLYRAPAYLSLAVLIVLGVAACTRSQAPTAAEIETALESQLRNQGIPCNILDYSNIKVNDSSAPSNDVAQVDIDMDVKLVGADFPPDCEQFMSDTDGAWKAERAVQRIISGYGERDSMAYEWQLSGYDLRLTRDSDDAWQVVPVSTD